MKLTKKILRQLIQEQIEQSMSGPDQEETVVSLLSQLSDLPKNDAIRIADKLRAKVAKLPEKSAREEGKIEPSVEEKLDKDATAGEYVKDFRDSDAPQFKGKSKKKKQQMAIAAYLDAQDDK